jgi:hypothetical protein
VVLADPLAHVQVSGSIQQMVMEDRMGCVAAIGLALGSVAE